MSGCTACAETLVPSPVLSRLSGPPNADIMLVGEAPGRLGAARTDTPFQGDESGRRLDRLITAAGLTREELFITNAVLCNPTDAGNRNRPPRATEIKNCGIWMAEQIEVVDPFLIVALGAVALRALEAIEPHALRVKDSDRDPVEWNGRYLAARYHPSARAAIHRPVEQQISDFQILGAWLRNVSDGSAGAR